MAFILRDSLTVLAGLLILALTAALVVPYVVDWRSERRPIETRLSAALGADASIAGAIELKFLPTPYFLVENVAISSQGGEAQPRWRLTAKRLRLELAPAPLLRGQFHFVEARLESPLFQAVLGRDGAWPTLRQGAGALQNSRFDKIYVSDGTLRIEDPARNRSGVIERLALEASAESLEGPFRGSGAFDLGGARIPFRFATGERAGDEVKLKFSTESRGGFPSAVLDGALRLSGGGSFAGAARFESAVPVWRLSGRLMLEPAQAALSGAEFSLGEARPFIAAGEAAVDFSGAPKASATLHSDTAEFDFKAGSALAGLIRAPPFPLTVSYSAQSALIAGAPFSDLAATLVFGKPRPGEDASPWLRFEAKGEGRSRISLDGKWRPETGGYEGKVQANGEDMRWLAAWLKNAAPAFAPSTIPFRAIDLSATARLSPDLLELSDIALRTEDFRLSGRFAYQPAAGGAAPRFEADFAAPSINLGALREAGFESGLNGVFGAADGSLRLESAAVAARGAASIGALSLLATKVGDRIALDQFAIKGSGDAFLIASGFLSKDGGRWNARVAAPKEDRIIAALASLLSDRTTGAVLAQAGALTPIDLDVAVRTARKDGALAIETLSAKGAMGGAAIDATLADDSQTPGAFSFSASVDAKESLPLLRLLGWRGVTGALGPAHVEANAHGRPGGLAQMKAHLLLGAARFDFDGEANADLGSPSAKGALRLATPDAAPLLRAAELAFPDLSLAIPVAASADVSLSKTELTADRLKAKALDVSLEGALAWRREGREAKGELTGAIEMERLPAEQLFALVLGPPEPAKAGALWPSLAFAPALFDLPEARIELKLREVPLPAFWPSALPARNAALTLVTGPSFLQMRGLALDLGAGRLKGELALRRDGSDASLESRLEVSDLPLDLPSLRGRLSASLDLTGIGKSGEALVAGLAGSGQARIEGLVVPAADPAALARVVAHAELDERGFGKAELAARLVKEMSHADFVAGDRSFDIAAASGIARLSPAPRQAAGLDALSFDLRRGAFSQTLVFAMQPPPKDWSGAPPQFSAVFRGEAAAPTLNVDAAALSSALAMRAIERESARIADYEFDIHERAFFYQRLLSERRREQLKAQALKTLEGKPSETGDSPAPERQAQPSPAAGAAAPSRAD